MKEKIKKKREWIDYRNFRFHKLNTDEFRHLKLLLWWPFYGLAFAFVERFSPIQNYYPMHCRLDDMIPFNEFFVIPYLFWFVFLVVPLLYFLFFDVQSFRKMQWFIILTYSVTILIYLLFPTCQELRPAAFERDNIFTQFLTHFYQFDTNTNVCPSIHVIASASTFAIWDSKQIGTRRNKILSAVICFLICISTVFLKQHSVIDIVAAIPLCVIAWLIVYMPHKGMKRMEEQRWIKN